MAGQCRRVEDTAVHHLSHGLGHGEIVGGSSTHQVTGDYGEKLDHRVDLSICYNVTF